jgi:nucleoside-diphosphate-sugar epimerase
MASSPSKILVTGAAGFVGSHLTRLLLTSGVTVEAPVRPESDLNRISDLLAHPGLHLHRVDLTEATEMRDLMARISVDAGIHLAWSHGNPSQSFDFSANLVDALIAARCPRLILAGTCFEYDINGSVALSEDAPTKPLQPTDEAKLNLEAYAAREAAKTATTCVFARLFYLYGPGQPARHLVPWVITHLLAGDEAPLTSGHQRKDYLHVEDVAAALWALADNEVAGIVNVGSGSTFAVSEIATKIGEILDRSKLVRLGALPDRDNDPDFVCADNRKILRTTGWRPRYDLDRGLRETVSWWQRQVVGSNA